MARVGEYETQVKRKKKDTLLAGAGQSQYSAKLSQEKQVARETCWAQHTQPHNLIVRGRNFFHLFATQIQAAQSLEVLEKARQQLAESEQVCSAPYALIPIYKHKHQRLHTVKVHFDLY